LCLFVYIPLRGGRSERDRSAFQGNDVRLVHYDRSSQTPGGANHLTLTVPFREQHWQQVNTFYFIFNPTTFGVEPWEGILYSDLMSQIMFTVSNSDYS
jgi:hypothetical protein